MESVSYTPDSLPLDDDDYIVIAPFWADVDIRIGGEIYYRESTDPQLLQRATKDVRSVYFDMRAKGFQAKWVLVATWYEVPNKLKGDKKMNLLRLMRCFFCFSAIQ